MKKFIPICLTILIAHFSFSQVIELKELKTKKKNIETEIISLQSKLENINEEIQFIEDQINDSDVQNWIVIREYAELLEWPSSLASTIHRFKADTKVLLLDTKDEFLKVKSPFGTGYIKDRYLIDKTKETKSSTVSSKFISTPSRNYSQQSYKTSRRYITGPRGGCYYINSNGNKTYVDRSKC